ncbi:hypothetical protein A4D02_23190 [Niastella koreensis]|uniref:Porin n=2 Tax=Niastella koreensis TaxID=354356 RepID=G8TD15_NIAKG|nr:hypothetical protein [Niastella koreensis]AEV98247.1 hypothetical protein Niako_1889 [Niastella koreensis GR20-10]OQP53298.1 hypothetical protein A4D02_23190 [Niastella koreensis]
MRKLYGLAILLLPQLLHAQFDSLPNFRYNDKRGINVFETPKQWVDTADPFKIRLGAGFTQQFQALSHSNTTNDNDKAENSLYAISPGFTTAMANLIIDAQLTPGIRFNLTTYLSTRYHNEARLKEGYLQIDKLPFKGNCWNKLMKVMTIKAGYMEINYGDAHFRRSDGGQTIYNAFAENYILDAFTTEIATEVYASKNGFFAMGGISNGMNKGNVDSLVATPQDGNIHKSPALYVKGGIDKSVEDLFRMRVSGSFYHNGSSGGNSLYNGDRAGSNYYMVMEKAGPGVTYATNAFSGRLDPGFTKKVDALQLNALVKVIGFEIFATYEIARGRTATEENTREAKQLAVDWIYRFGTNGEFFIGSRYNSVKAQLAGFPEEVEINRAVMSAGYFFTKNILLKAEYVDQRYLHFPEHDYRYEGQFHGCMIQAVVGF